jgi:glycosyltransferase involved in cell wall biosynthesis
MQQAKPPILLVITLAEPGGATQFVLRFARYLQARGENVILLAGDGDWLFEQAKHAHLRIERLSALGRSISPLRDLHALWQLFLAFKCHHPAAIHLNSTKAGILGSLAARLAGCARVVYRIGGWVFLEKLPNWQQRLYLELEKQTARWKDVIVCVHPGDQTIAEEKKIRPRQKTLTIPNGIDSHSFSAQLLKRSTARQELGLPQDVFVFGTIAHFYPTKNLPLFIEACAEIHKAFPRALFALLGDGPERALLQTQIKRLHLEKDVLLVGAQPDAARFLLAFDGFVLPSAKEGMPSALLEAAAAGIPAIATDVGACAWILSGHGSIVPANDQPALVAAMKALLLDPEKAKKRADLAKATILARFPLATLLEEQANLLIS